MDNLQTAYKNLYAVIDQCRLTGPERRQLESDLKLLYSSAMDRKEESTEQIGRAKKSVAERFGITEEDDGGTDK